MDSLERNNLSKLNLTTDKIESVINSLDLSIIFIDHNSQITWCNSNFCALIDKLNIQVLYRDINSFLKLYTINNNKTENIFEICQKILKTNISEVYKLYINKHKCLYLNISVKLLNAPESNKNYVIILRDVTKEQELTYEKNKKTLDLQLAESIINNASIMYMVLSPELIIKKVSPSVLSTLKYTEQELLSCSVTKLFFFYDKNMKELGYFNKVFLSKNINDQEFTLITADNKKVPILLSTFKFASETNDIVLVTQNILEIKAAHNRIAYMSTHDLTTTLYNRSVFDDLVAKEISRCNRHGLIMALLVINIDNLKNINNVHGYTTSIEVLKNIARILKKSIRDEDILAHISKTDTMLGHLDGNEFSVILTDIKYPTYAASFSDRVLSLFKNPILINGKELYMTISIGITIFPEDAQSAAEMMNNAHFAMYQSQKLGGNNFSFYQQDYGIKYKLELETEARLHSALSNNQLFLVYQPQYSITDKNLRGIEVLLRWQCPNKGLVMPDKFIEIAERTRLIRDIGEFVLMQACIQYKSWQNKGFIKKLVYLSINVSPYQLIDGEFIKIVNNVIIKTKIDPKVLEFEITESAVMNELSGSEKVLDEIKKLGIKISIDDFGTGYSALSKIKELPINLLKIDKKFIQSMLNDKNDEFIVRSIIQLTKNLGLSVLAEGVEEQEQLQILNTIKCDFIQGYYYSKPLGVEKMELFLNKNNKA